MRAILAVVRPRIFLVSRYVEVVSLPSADIIFFITLSRASSTLKRGDLENGKDKIQVQRARSLATGTRRTSKSRNLTKKAHRNRTGYYAKTKTKVRLDVRYCYTDATTLTSNGLPKDEIRNTTINLQHRSVATFVGNYYCVDTILGTADIALLRRQSLGHLEQSID